MNAQNRRSTMHRWCSSFIRLRTLWALLFVSICWCIVRTFQIPEPVIVDTPSPFPAGSNLRPLILLWTTVWDKTAENLQLSNLQCPDGPIKCDVTNVRDASSEAVAILFHARDHGQTDLPATKIRGQPWIVWNHESPNNSPLRLYRNIGRYFDLELSYRRDSDIFVPYGYITDSPDHEVYSEKELQHRFQKQVGAVWLVSNCNTPSNRESYVRELATFFPVTVYGKCGTQTCAKSEPCMSIFSEKYMFYLSFENSLCPDYLTEKFFGALNHPMIPVVFSGSRDPKLDGLKAFVDASTIKPEELAKTLHAISRNYTEYKSYFQWKRTHKSVSELQDICTLCDFIMKNGGNLAKFNRSKKIELFDDHVRECRTWNGVTQAFEGVDS